MGIDQARLVHYEINRAVHVRPSAKEIRVRMPQISF